MIHTIFDKPIICKTYGCNLCGQKGCIQPPMVNIFVKVTNACNANCKFCSNANCRELHNKTFDIEKLKRVFQEIENRNILINRVNLTGGEPSLQPTIVHDICSIIPDKAALQINTNGLTEESQKIIRQEKRFDYISMSFHHYDLKILQEIYGLKKIPIINFDDIDKDKLNLACVLIRGYIDNQHEVEKMLDFADSLGIKTIGFVGLMKINDYCKNHYVDLSEIHFNEIPNVKQLYWQDRGADCRCQNFIRNDLNIYFREYANPNFCESSLLFDGQYLRQGFNSDNIIY